MMTSEVYGVLGIIIAAFIISVLLIWWARYKDRNSWCACVV